MERFKLNPKYTGNAVRQDPTTIAVFTDDTYIVERHITSPEGPYACRLAIKRIDREPIRSWRELQDIKNDVVGADTIAIEIYPRKSEVTDTANIYRLRNIYSVNSRLIGKSLLRQRASAAAGVKDHDRFAAPRSFLARRP